MNSPAPSSADFSALQAEIDELRQQSELYRQTLNALRAEEQSISRRADSRHTARISGIFEMAYRTLFEAMDHGVALIDAEHRVLYANQRFSDFIQCPQEVLLQSSLLKQIPEQVRGIFSNGLKKAGQEQIPGDGRLSLPRPGADPWQLQARLIPLPSANGVLLGVILTDLEPALHRQALLHNQQLLQNRLDNGNAELAINQEELHQLRNMAKRLVQESYQSYHQMQNALTSLQDSKTRYRLLADNSSDFIYWADTQAQLQYVSPACQTITGFAPEDFMADPALLGRLVDPEDGDLFLRHFNNIFEEIHNELEFRIRHADGSQRWLAHSCQAMHDDFGVCIGRIASNRDITKRKQVEITLRQQEQQFRQLFNHMSSGALVCEAIDEGKDFLLVDANQSVELIDGLALSALLGERITTAFPGAAEFGLLSALGRVWQSGQPERLPAHLYRDQRISGWRTYYLYRLDNQRVVAIYDDLTETMHAQEALRASESRYRLLADHASDMISLHDLQGRCTFATPASLALLGLPPQEILGYSIYNWIHPDDIARVRHLHTELLDGKAANSIEYRLRKLDGSYHWVESTGRRLPEQPEILAITRDISERRRTEDQLRKLSLAVEQNPSAIIITDLVGSIEYVNTAFMQVTGYAYDEVKGRNPRILKSGVTPVETFSAMWAALTHGQIWRGEITNRRKDGTLYIDFSTIARIHNLEGHPTHYVAIQEDITERKRIGQELDHYRLELETMVEERTAQLSEANRSLQAQEAFIRTITNHYPGLIAYLDTQLRYRFANASYLSWLGIDPQSLLERPAREVWGEARYAQVKTYLLAALSGEPQRFEMTITTVDGAPLEVSVQYFPDIRDGKVQGIYLTAHDITELTESHRQLAELNDQLAERAVEAESAAHSKSEFLANMSHEIRTPMNAILGLNHLLQRNETDQVKLLKLHKIEEASQHLLRLINDILDFSKIEAHKLRLESTDFLLSGVLDNILSMSRPRAEEKGLQLTAEWGELPSVLVGDPTRIIQALLNYLTNAIKFTEQGKITLKVVVLEQNPQQVHLRFDVMDTGIGIPADHLKQLFQPFVQADSSTSRKFGGTGLGLAITARLAELMGGEVGAESIPGVGSTFWFTANLAISKHTPAQVARHLASQSRNHLEPSPKNVRLLVVEDNFVNQEVAREVLRDVGFQVTIANHGAEALEIAAHESFDLILMDMQMPVMDGVTATQKFRQLPAYRDIPILAMTANAFDEDRERCLAAGMNDFVPKPVNPDNLFTMLNRWLAKPAETEPMPEHATLPLFDPRLHEQLHPGARVLVAESNPINQEVILELFRETNLDVMVDLAENGEEAVSMAHLEKYDIFLLDLQLSLIDGFSVARKLRQQTPYQTVPIIGTTASAPPDIYERCLAAGMTELLLKPMILEILYAALLRWLPKRETKAASVAAPDALNEESSLLVRLEAIPGVDTVTGLEQLGGRTTSYFRLLRKYAQIHQEELSLLRRQLNDGHGDEARRLAHGLKGASATLGLPGIQTLAAALELAIKEGQSPEMLTNQFERLNSAFHHVAKPLLELLPE